MISFRSSRSRDGNTCPGDDGTDAVEMGACGGNYAHTRYDAFAAGGFNFAWRFADSAECMGTRIFLSTWS